MTILSNIYMEWIVILGLSFELMTFSVMNDEITLTRSQNDIKNFPYSLNKESCLILDFKTSENNNLVKKLLILPWQDLYANDQKNDQLPKFPGYELLTVTEHAIVFNKILLNPIPGENELTKQLDQCISKIVNKQENSKLLQHKTGITICNGLQVIKEKTYTHHMELDISIPGSKMEKLDELKNYAPGKMILLRLVPEDGSVKEQWIQPQKAAYPVCIDKKKEEITLAIKKGFQNCIHKPTVENKNVQAKKTMKKICQLLDQEDCAPGTKEYINGYLSAIFLLNMEKQNPYEDPFPGYQPKTTPDLATDYMPSLHKIFEELPKPTIENLNVLIQQFKEYRKKTNEHPGEWIDGNQLLGANEKEYKPSQEELVLNELGKRVKTILETYNKNEIKDHLKDLYPKGMELHYQQFTFVHYDVMGSGRFFYIDNIEEVKLKIP